MAEAARQHGPLDSRCLDRSSRHRAVLARRMGTEASGSTGLEPPNPEVPVVGLPAAVLAWESEGGASAERRAR
jgi:hypothetical protein